MKIAVSAAGTGLDAAVDPRFGRCAYFIIVDPETMDSEAMDNSGSSAAGGAGIAAAQTISAKGIEAVLTGNCGPNAHQVLSAAGIKVITGVSGKIRDAVGAYSAGKLTASEQPNVSDHFGMGRK
jgi:predicted Fe-Mo cluster-binding NifX family protein